jgi:hypothetical protein
MCDTLIPQILYSNNNKCFQGHTTQPINLTNDTDQENNVYAEWYHIPRS